MTMYFPLVVHGAMLIEPTETESKASLDQFIVARPLDRRARQGGRPEPQGRADLCAAPAPRRNACGAQAGADIQGAASRQKRRSKARRGEFECRCRFIQCTDVDQLRDHRSGSSWSSWRCGCGAWAKMRPLKLGTLWVVPALYLVVAGSMLFWQLPPTGWVAHCFGRRICIGAAVGWQRGKMMHIHVDPETHALIRRLRRGDVLPDRADRGRDRRARRSSARRGGVSRAMCDRPADRASRSACSRATRVEMYLRAKRLLEEVRGRT